MGTAHPTNYENSSFFLDIIECGETFSEQGFQVSGWLSRFH
jgi:hypothetical protein